MRVGVIILNEVLNEQCTEADDGQRSSSPLRLSVVTVYRVAYWAPAM